MYWTGKGFYIKNKKIAKVNDGVVVDRDSFANHKKAAHNALLLVKRIYEEVESGMRIVDLLIMDEINQTVSDKLLTEKQILNVLSKRGKVPTILTGRNCPGEITKIADLVTEMKKIKHPFDNGIMAVQGLDF